MSNFKSFKGGKSKAIKGLARMNANLPTYADELLTAGAEKGEFLVDMDKVTAMLANWAQQDAELGEVGGVATGDSESVDVAPATAPVAETEVGGDDDVYTPRENGNMFGGMALALSNAAATTPAPMAQTTARVANRGAYKIEKERPEQNGIKRPSAGGLCRAVWDEMDHIQASTGEVPTTAHVRTAATAKNWNVNNAMIEYYQWRKYNGITGRAKKAAAATE